jgi:dihydrofolate synthase/folylpolyglutamate synthase
MSAYQTAVSELYRLGHELHRTPSYKFDLQHMRVLCQALGSPQTRFASVLIAGTNGKGSTAATLASILRAAGYKTGLYTSPHLVRINERIRVLRPGKGNAAFAGSSEGEPIADAHFAAVYGHVHKLAAALVAEGSLPWHPSFFETMTALAFEHFARQGVQIAVVEVGMGGRLDATNVLEPLISVITDIDLDHQKFLGNTIAEIAGEKAGIMRAGRPLITLPQHPEANAILGKAILESGAVPVNAARYVAVFPASNEAAVAAGTPRVRQERAHNAFAMDIMGEEVEIVPSLLGRHQLRNLALAISAAEELNKCGFAISARQVAEGVGLTCWPGRFQVIAGPPDGSRPEMVLDVAHNTAGAWALRAGLSENISLASPGHPSKPEFRLAGDHAAGGGWAYARPLVMVFGAMRDKAIREMAGILFPLAESVLLCTPAGNPRAATTAELAEAAAGYGTPLVQAPAVAEAVRQASQHARQLSSSSLLVITGSIYVVGEAMQALGMEP